VAKSDIGTITVYLKSESANFDKSMKSAGASLKSLKSSIKSSGIAFTEFQSKISLVSGAVEVVGKGIQSVMLAMNGDMDSLDKTMASLPLGIGPAVKVLQELRDAMFGVAKSTEQADNKLKQMQDNRIKYATASGKAVADQAKMSEDIRERMAREGMSDAAQARRDVEQNAEKARKLVMESTRGVVPGTTVSMDESGDIDYSMRSGMTSADHTNAQELYDLTVARVGMINEEERIQLGLLQTEQDRLRAVQDYEYITKNVGEAIDAQRKSAREQMADIRARGTHEVSIMTSTGRSQESILARQLKMQKDIAAVIEDWTAMTKDVSFDRLEQQGLALEEIDRVRAEHAASMRRDVESLLAAELAKNKKSADGPTAASNAFSTAVGQIVLPDARATQDIARSQLREQQLTTEAIDGLRDELASITQGNP
jgi:hypothetical protein